MSIIIFVLFAAATLVFALATMNVKTSINLVALGLTLGFLAFALGALPK